MQTPAHNRARRDLWLMTSPPAPKSYYRQVSVFFSPYAIDPPTGSRCWRTNADLYGNPVTPQNKLAVCAAASRSGSRRDIRETSQRSDAEPGERNDCDAQRRRALIAVGVETNAAGISWRYWQRDGPSRQHQGRR